LPRSRKAFVAPACRNSSRGQHHPALHQRTLTAVEVLINEDDVIAGEHVPEMRQR